MIRRSHHNSSKSKARISRIRDKAQKLREQVKRSTVAFFERREARVAWWQQAFRTPMVGFYGWAKSQCSSLLAAMFIILGLSPKSQLHPRASAVRKSKSSRQGVMRGMLYAESLETRQLLAADTTAIDLLAASDSGQSPTDDLTNVTSGALFSVNYTKTTAGQAPIVLHAVSPVGPTLGTSANTTGGNGSSNTLSITADLSSLGDGSHVLYAVGGGPNNATLNITIDRTSPTVSLTTSANNPTHLTPIPVTVTFNEDVFNLTGGDFSVTNGSVLSLVPVSGSVYTLNVTPAANGAVAVNLGVGAAQDAAGNDSAAATQFNIVSDTTAPTATISSTASPGPTNVSPIPFAILFSESVDGLQESEITVVNGIVSGLAGTGNNYSFVVTPTGQGLVSVSVNAGAVYDATGPSGNTNAAIGPFSITYDSVQPTVAISSTSSPGPTNVSPIPVTVTFNESVTGFDASDLAVFNGTPSGFSGSGTTYTFVVTPTGQGAVTVDVPASVAIDSASNSNTAAPQFSIVYDSVGPTVAISSTASPGPTNVSPIPVTVTFNESVTGFDASDLAVFNGTPSGFSGSGTTYTFVVTPTGQGAVTVDVPASVAIDSASNSNTAAPQFSIVYDSVGPTVAISSTASPGPTNVSPIPVTVTFNESVTGFDASDLAVFNGTPSGFSGSGTTYTFVVTPIGQGAVTVDVPASVAIDSASNLNYSAPQFTIVYDSVAPVAPVIVSANDNQTPVTGTLSSGGVTNDVTPTLSGTAEPNSSVSIYEGVTLLATVSADGGGAWTYTTSALTNGLKSFTATATDLANNTSVASTPFTLTIDNVAPTVLSIAQPAAGTYKIGDVITYVVTFTEPVTIAGTISLKVDFANPNGGTLVPRVFDLVTPVYPTTTASFSYTVVEGDDDPDGIRLRGHGPAGTLFLEAGATLTDAAGNNRTSATQDVITQVQSTTVKVDGVKPTITGLVLSDSTINESNVAGSVTLTVTFSESMNQTVSPTITSNAGSTLSQTAATWLNATQYQVTYSVLDANINVPSVLFDISGAKDVAGVSAGNLMTAVTNLATTPGSSIDTITPTVIITSTDGTGGNVILSGETATVTFNFNEVVSFSAVTVSGGTVGSISGSGAGPYTVLFTPNLSFTGVATVTATTFSDLAGNPGTATTINLDVDTAVPTITTLTVNKPLVHDTNLAGGLVLTATYSETMNSAVNPTVVFAPSIASTLGTPVFSWAGAVLTITYPLIDANVKVDDIDVTITGAQDPSGNIQASYTAVDLLDVNTAGIVTAVVNEDSSVDFSVSIDGGTITGFNSLPTTFGSLLNLGGGVVRYTPNAEYFGAASFGFTLSTGLVGTANVTVNPVNDIPTFNLGAAPTVLEDAGAQTIAGFLSGASKGPANETSQTLSVTVTNNDNSLFLVQPSIDINTGNLTFTPAANAFGSATVSVIVSDDGGTVNGGVDTSIAQQFVITVTPVNDAPTFTLGAAPTVLEDAGAQSVSGFLTVTSKGALNEAAQAVSVAVSNSNNGLFSAQPSIDVNTGVLTFTPAANANGTATVTVTLTDDGGTANGGVNFSTQQFVITVTAVNDAPVAANQTLGNINEDTTLTITAAQLLVGATDIDLPTQTLSVASLTIFSGGGTITGSSPTWTYTPAANYNGPVVLNYTLSDGSLISNVANASFNVLAVNDAPLNTVPGNQTTSEDTAKVFSAANGNAITVSDLDVAEGTGLLEVTLSVTTGVLTLGGTAGLTFSAGDGTSDTGMTFQGTALAINSALNGLTFLPTLNFNGNAILTIVTSDLGNTGSGGALTDPDTVQITVTAVNDAPTNAGTPPTQTVTEDVLSPLNLGAFNFSDVDSTSLTVTLMVAAGTLTVSSGGSVTASPNGTASNSVTLTGTVADLNTFFNGPSNIQYLTALNSNVATTVSVSLNDGAGGTLAIPAIAINITPVNDAPTNAGTPPTQTVTEDVLSPLNLGAFNFSDVDSTSLTVTLMVAAGTLTVSSGGSVTASPNGTASNSVTLTGTVADLNTFFNGPSNIQYLTALNSNVATTVSVSLNDGAGGTLAIPAIAINITPVNDAPTNAGTLPPTQVVLEDFASALNLSNLTVADVDSATLNVILAANSGTLAATSGGGVTVTNSGTSTVTLNGSLSALNGFLDSPTAITYTGASNNFGVAAASLTVTINDGALSTVLTPIAIDITPVNDAPTFTLGAAPTVLEDAGAQSVSGFLTVTSKGALNEAAQAVSVAVSNSNNGLFSAQPSIDVNTGVLTFTPAANANGTATVTVTLTDDGGTANGGVNFSTQQFVITVTAVNDAPVAANQTLGNINEDTTLTITAAQLLVGAADIDLPTQTLSVASLTIFSGGGTITGSSPTWTYTPAANYNGPVVLNYTLSDGSLTSNVANASFNVLAVNDAPFLVNTLPLNVSAVEDTASPISLLPAQIGDVDAGAGNLTLTLATTGGALTASSGSLSITGSGSSTLNLTGTLTNLNTFLTSGNLAYQGLSNVNGTSADFIFLVVTDNGNTGSNGGGLIPLGSVAVNISAENDNPFFNGNFAAGQSTNEDTPVVLNLAGVTLEDVDAGLGIMTLTLTADVGTLAASGALTGITTGGAGNVVTLTGTRANINAVLAGTNGTVTYSPVLNDTTSRTITASATDGGNTGAGGTLGTLSNKVLSIALIAQNDDPTFTGTLPTLSLAEEGTVDVNLSGIVLDDVDAGTSPTQLTLTAGSGSTAVVVPVALTGLITVGGTGSVRTITGTVANLNLLLQDTTAIKYTGALNVVGPNVDTVGVVFSDLGSTGAGGTKTVNVGTINVTITPVNDAPTVVGTLPSDVTVLEEIATGINLSAITFADVDAASGNTRLTLSTGAGLGSLSIVVPAPLVGLLTVGGTGQARTIEGTLANINALLQSPVGAIMYTGVVDLFGSDVDTITVAFNDLGSTGAGAPQSVTAGTINVDIDPVNDAPTVVMPVPVITVAEDASIAITGITVGDVDAAAAPLTLQLSVANGTLTSANGGGVTVTGSGSASITLTGSQAALNAFLAIANVTYAPTPDYFGTDTLTAVVNDGGASGFPGTPLSATATKNITVTPVNDAPTAAPLTLSTNEDVVLSNASVLTGVSFGPANEAQTLTLLGGTQPANGSVTYNLLLGEITYSPNLDFNGPDTFSVTIADNGSPSLSVVRVITVNVAPLNDNPVDTGGLPAVVSVNEDILTNVDLSSVNLVDVDAGTSPVTVKLSTTLGGTLSAVNGGGVIVANSPSSAITLTGSIADLNAYLNIASSVKFQGAANVFGTAADSIDVKVNDNGNTGTGGGTDVTLGTVNVDIVAVNDAPTFTLAGNQTTPEDSPQQTVTGFLTAASPGPSNESGQSLGVSISTTNNALFSVLPSIDLITGDLTYTPAANANGVVTVTVTLTDTGGILNGGVNATSQTFNIDISAVNDNPTVVAPMSFLAIEDQLSTITGVSIGDIDAGAGLLQVTLSVAHGVITLASTTGLTFSAGDGTADASMTFTGTLTDLNAALVSIGYTPTLNYNGSDTLSISVDDQGNTGSGGAQTASGSTAINVFPVNDSPVNTAPVGPLSMTENTTQSFTGPNAISVSDIDVNPAVANAEVELSVTNGILTLGSLVGLTVTAGANASSSVTVLGTFTALNAALATLVYTPTLDFNGNATLSISTNDLGNTGAGSPLVDNDSFVIQVLEANTAPVFSGALPLPGIVSIAEDATGNLSFGTLQVADADAGASPLKLTLTATVGTLTSTFGGVTITGSGTSEIVVIGTQTQLNSLFSTAGAVTYQGPSNQNNLNTPTAPSITVKVSDQGNTGAGPIGGYEVTAGSFTVNLTPTNDLPTITAPAAVTATEDIPFSFTAANLISIADIDAAEAGTENLTVTLSVTNGSLNTTNVSGTLAVINAALALLIFTPASNYSGAAELTIDVNDNGNTGTGPTTASATVAITVNAVDDVPGLIVPAAQATQEDAAIVFSVANSNAISVSDTDSSTLTVSLSVAQGTLTLAGVAGLAFTIGDGTGDASMTFSGTASAINTALNGLQYQPTINYNGSDTLAVTVADAATTVPGSVAITISAVNDNPQNLGTLPAVVTVNEDLPGNVDLSSIDLFDFDAAPGNLTVTLATSSGGSLSAISGGGVVVAGSGSSITLTGTPTALNAYFDVVTSVQFTGASNVFGTGVDSITVSVSDNGNTGSGGGGQISLGSIPVDILAVNDAPTFVLAGNQNVGEDSGPHNVVNFLTSPTTGAVNETQTLTVTVTNSNNALFSVQPSINLGTGELTYTLASNANGSATVTVKLKDNGGTSNGGIDETIQTFLINVSPTNDAPVAGNVTLPDAVEDTPYNFTSAALLANTTDVDDPSLSVTSVTVTTGSGVISNPSAGNWVFTPALNWNGAVVLNFVASDGSASSAASASFNVQAVNDAPVLTLPLSPVPMTEGQTIVLKDLPLGVSDADSGANSLTIDLILGAGGVFSTVPAFVLSGGSFNILTSTHVQITGTVAELSSLGGPLSAVQVSFPDSDPGSAAFAVYSMSVSVTDNFFVGPLEGTASGNVTFHVSDAAPTITLSGAAVITEGTNYVLTLGPWADPAGTSADQLVQMVIYWGDGSANSYSASSPEVLALNANPLIPITVIHPYADDAAMVENMIRVSLYSQGKNDEVNISSPKEYANAGSLAISVQNGAPSADIATLGLYPEGTPSGVLSIFNVFDPSSIDAALLDYSVDFGDDGFYEIILQAVPSNSFNVPIPGSLLADNGNKPIRVVISDKDGGDAEYLVTVPVTNVAPTLASIPTQTATVGVPLTINGTFTDPGLLDSPWAVQADWGAGFVSEGTTATQSFSVTHTFASVGPQTVSLRVVDKDGGVSSTITFTVNVNPVTAASVAGRHIFYNGSAWDGNGATVTAADSAAIATDKQALLPNNTASFNNYTSSFNNYTSYSRGLNGIFVDINNLASTPTLSTIGDFFQFRVGNDNNPSLWTSAPTPSAVGVLAGQGVGGSDRVYITWNNGAIVKQWLQVIVKDGLATGLAQRDVHYWGNNPGEVGNTPTNFAVSSADLIQTNNAVNLSVLVGIAGPFDFNRDKVVSSADVIISNNNVNLSVLLVKLVAPVSGSGNEG